MPIRNFLLVMLLCGQVSSSETKTWMWADIPNKSLSYCDGKLAPSLPNHLGARITSGSCLHVLLGKKYWINRVSIENGLNNSLQSIVYSFEPSKNAKRYNELNHTVSEYYQTIYIYFIQESLLKTIIIHMTETSIDAATENSPTDIKNITGMHIALIVLVLFSLCLLRWCGCCGCMSNEGLCACEDDFSDVESESENLSGKMGSVRMQNNEKKWQKEIKDSPEKTEHDEAKEENLDLSEVKGKSSKKINKKPKIEASNENVKIEVPVKEEKNKIEKQFSQEHSLNARRASIVPTKPKKIKEKFDV